MKKVLLRVAQNRLFLYDTNRVIVVSSTLLEIADRELNPNEIDDERGFCIQMMGHRWFISKVGNGDCNEEEVERVMIELINNNGKSAFH